MDTLEAVLLVAEKALAQSRQALEIAQALQAAPKGAVSISAVGKKFILRNVDGTDTEIDLSDFAVPGPRGNDADPVNVKDVAAAITDSQEIKASLGALVAESVSKHFSDHPVPKGDKGDAGRDADPIEVSEVVRALAACEEIVPILSMLVAEAVSKHFIAHPVKDGRDGRDALPADPIKGDQGDKGADGRGIAGAVIDRGGNLILTMTNGQTENLGRVVGEPGKDGADLSDVAFDYDGHRTVTVKAKAGEVAKVYKLPVPMDKGYWREGMECEKGDIVTHDGNAWIARRDTNAKPCHENKDDWRLFARKGRDGKDGEKGRDLGPPPPVKLNGA